MVHEKYRWFLRNIMLPLGDLYFQQGLMPRLRFLEDAQWWDAARIEQYRTERLAQLMRIAYEEVPFYRRQFDDSGLHWRDIRCPADLRSFPVVTKDMLRAAYPKLCTRATRQHCYPVSSSGSTGESFWALEDAETAGQYRAAFLLALRWAGWRLGDPHFQIGAHPERGLMRKLKDVFLRCHYVFTDNLSNSNLDDILKAIEHRKILYLLGYPSSIHMLALRAQHLRWNRNFPSIITWGEVLHSDQREDMERIFGSRVFDTYGCAEGIQIAAQCREGPNYHIHSLDTIVEFVDDSGRPVPSGCSGNVLLTRLHPGPMPFIRYRVGDMATRSVNQECPCGRHFEIIGSIEGRDVDLILTPDGNRLVDHFFTGALSAFPEVEAFQVVQHDRENVTLEIVAPGAPPTLAERLRKAMSPGVDGLRLDIEIVPEIHPVRGKRRFIVNELPREVIRACLPNASR